MSELWGFTSGQQEAKQDDNKNQMVQLSLAQGQQSLAIGAMDIEQRKMTLDNAKLMKTRQEQALKLFQQGQAKAQSTGDPTQDTANSLFQMAQADFDSGLPEQGMDAVKEASGLAANHAKIVGETTKAQIEKFSFFSNLADDVKDQKSWDQAKMLYQSQFPGQLDPKIANRPYSPELIEQLKAGSQTALQKAQTEDAKAQEVLRKADARRADSQLSLDRERVNLEKQREARLSKAGGTEKLPTPAEIKMAADLIKRDRGADVPTSVAEAAALPIAERAKTLMRVNGIPSSQAYQQAFTEAKTKGDLEGIKGKAAVKNADLMSQANTLLDRIIDTATTDPKVAGIRGSWYERPKEAILNNLGYSDETKAADFEGDVKDLQMMIPKLQSLGMAKYKMQEITKVVRGVAPGDSAPNVISAARKLKNLLNGTTEGEPKAAGKIDRGGFNVGQTYVDAQGNSAVYQADGTWKQL